MGYVAAIIDSTGSALIAGEGEQWKMQNGWEASAIGEPRYRQLCRYKFVPKECAVQVTAAFLVSEIVPKLIGCLSQNECVTKKEDKLLAPGQLLIASGGALFVIDSDFEVQGPATYACIGSTRQASAAHGAFFATQELGGFPAQMRLEIALAAAKRCGPGGL